jgi:hypothetical protein
MYFVMMYKNSTMQLVEIFLHERGRKDEGEQWRDESN